MHRNKLIPVGQTVAQAGLNSRTIKSQMFKNMEGNSTNNISIASTAPMIAHIALKPPEMEK